MPIPDNGFLRLKQVLELIPVSKSTWWSGVSAGRFPQPVSLTARTTAWRVEDIRAVLQKLSAPERAWQPKLPKVRNHG